MLVRVVLNIDKEPFFKLKYGLNYLKDGYFFPSYKKIDFRSKIIVKTEANFKYVHYNAQQVCYPLKWPDRLIVENFNNLINENTKAQSELHQNLKQDLDTTRMAYKQEPPQKYIVDNDTKTVNVPTSKSLLTFKKEKKYYRASEEQKQKRLAEELSEAE